MLVGWFTYEPRSEFCEPEPPLATLPDTTGYFWDTCDLLLLATLQLNFKDSTRLPDNNI